ncbi:MAG: 4,5-DOPA dioxygenase extradiol [Bacteroidetes bacterium]|nr:MAG: 4,5-DOPA dioxygenase extradiol [Bacteroidota bacterium]
MDTRSITSELLSMPDSEEMPILFVGHGNPMNAIEDNVYSKMWKKLGTKLPTPKAILVVSAHWETKGTQVLVSEKPRTIHDFGGFPRKLFEQQYPAPGAPAFAKETAKLMLPTKVAEDLTWGLDHGTWSVLLPMYPEAKIPVYQLSLDYTQGAAYHYKIASQLSKLRKKGVLIVGSGNVVHNLGRVQWGKQGGYDWAVEFDTKVKNYIDTENHQALVDYTKIGNSANLSIPSNEHYLPLLYVLANRKKGEKPLYFNDTLEMGSISMRSVIFGAKDLKLDK